MNDKKIIKITCDSKDYLSIDRIQSLQGGLKDISKKSMAKMKKSIIKNGFSFPVFIWKNKNNYFSLDGIHRCLALKELKEIDKYEIPNKIPVIYVKAKNKIQAKELILAASSQYASINNNFLMNNFLSDIKIDDIKSRINISLKKIDDEIVMRGDIPEYMTFIVDKKQRKIIENRLKDIVGVNNTEKLVRLCKK